MRRRRRGVAKWAARPLPAVRAGGRRAGAARSMKAEPERAPLMGDIEKGRCHVGLRLLFDGVSRWLFRRSAEQEEAAAHRRPVALRVYAEDIHLRSFCFPSGTRVRAAIAAVCELFRKPCALHMHAWADSKAGAGRVPSASNFFLCQNHHSSPLTKSCCALVVRASKNATRQRDNGPFKLPCFPASFKV